LARLGDVAEAIGKTFYEIVIAPDFEEEALDILRKKRDLRILRAQPPSLGGLDYRRVVGGLLVQERDNIPDTQVQPQTVTKRAPTEAEMRDLLFANRAVKHIKSNSIVFVKNSALMGMGAGQPNRVISVEIAAKKAGDRSKGSVMASDAMFPFSDSVEQAAAAGVTAIIQPGGSIRDEDSIKAADKHGLVMVLTGMRHFWH
jgi:phosphoribosylaminoimidazolecarboxamide formyltransferase/IMP cyclohydrolase